MPIDLQNQVTAETTYSAQWMKAGRMLSIRCSHGDCTEEMWHHVRPRSNTKVSTNDKHVQFVHQTTNVVRLELVPASLPHVGLVDWLRVFDHDSFFMRVNCIIQCVDAFLPTFTNKNYKNFLRLRHVAIVADRFRTAHCQSNIIHSFFSHNKLHGKPIL